MGGEIGGGGRERKLLCCIDLKGGFYSWSQRENCLCSSLIWGRGVSVGSSYFGGRFWFFFF